MGCNWLTDSVVANLASIKTLEFIHIGHTNITTHGSNSIKNFKNLRCLHIGSTRIKGTYVVELAKSNRGLKKLSIFALSGSEVVNGRGTVNNKQMIQIGFSLPSLTHLDIGAC